MTTKHAIIEPHCEIFKRLTYPVIILDEDLMPLWANNKFLSFHQIKKTDLSNNQELQNKIIHSLTNNLYELVKSNKHFYFEPKSSNIEIKGEKISVISFFDITKLKKQEVKLLAKHSIFEPISELSPEGIILSAERINYTNPTFEKLIGYSGKVLQQKKLEDIIDLSDQALYKENIKKLHTQRRSQIKSVLKLNSSNNKSIWVRIKTSLLKQGDSISYLNVVNDISHEQLEFDRLSRLANFDELTGIYNRRKFNELCDLEYKQAKRYQRPLCGLFFDIDHFKKINDNYGHDAGDLVLEHLANLIMSCTRETDIFARWGGEEFCIILPETLTDNALIMAEHIRQTVNSHIFPKVKQVSVSIGITQLKGNERLETFIKRMDKALYIAKENGRNCCVTL